MKLFDVSVPSKDVENDDKDVAAQHPEIVDRLWGYLEQSHVDSPIERFHIDVSRK